MDQDLMPVFVADLPPERPFLQHLAKEQSRTVPCKHVRESWTHEQENYLIELKITKETYTYVDIAKLINAKFGTSRSAKTVERRWDMTSNPNLKKEKFSREEKHKLKELFERFKGCNRLIRKNMPGRSIEEITKQLKKMHLIDISDDDLV